MVVSRFLLLAVVGFRPQTAVTSISSNPISFIKRFLFGKSSYSMVLCAIRKSANIKVNTIVKIKKLSINTCITNLLFHVLSIIALYIYNIGHRFSLQLYIGI